MLTGFLGDSYPSILQSGNGSKKGGRSILASSLQNQNSANKDVVSSSSRSRQSASDVSHVEDSNFSNGVSTLTGGSLSADRTIAKGVQSDNGSEPSEGSNGSSNRSDLSMNILDEGQEHDSPDFEQFFQEGYCKASALSECPESTEVVTDVDSSSRCDGEKCEEDGDNDDMLGGVFAFSEEGWTLIASNFNNSRSIPFISISQL